MPTLKHSIMLYFFHSSAELLYFFCCHSVLSCYIMILLWLVHVPTWLIETNTGYFSFKVSSGLCSFFLLDIPSNQLHCMVNLPWKVDSYLAGQESLCFKGTHSYCGHISYDSVKSGRWVPMFQWKFSGNMIIMFMKILSLILSKAD